jgi:hypothetical protein
MSAQQFVDGHVGGEKGEAIGKLEPTLAERTTGADAGHAERGFVDQLQRQPWLEVLPTPPRPATEEVPNTQAKQLGDEQPETDQVTRNFIGQALANTAFQAFGIRRHRLDSELAGLRGSRLRDRAVAIEFFFEGRTSR